MGAEIDPRVHLRRFEEGGSVKFSVVSDTSYITSNSIAFEDAALRGLEDRDASQRRLLQELRFLGICLRIEFRDFNIEGVVFCGDENLESAEISEIGVELQSHDEIMR